MQGGRILGTYPDRLGDDGEWNIGRGRVLPSTSWESMWRPVAQWMGVEDDRMATVLPNLANFPDAIDMETLYKRGTEVA